MKMDGLINIYKDMKNKKITYTDITMQIDNIVLCVLFDIKCSPFSFFIAKPHSNLYVKVAVANGFLLDTNLLL